MNEDEAKTVAAVAAECAQGPDKDRWSLIMRYGRLFTPDPESVRGPHPDQSSTIAWNTYQRATTRRSTDGRYALTTSARIRN